MSAVAVGANFKEPAITVSHAALPAASEQSPYQKECPVCKEGLLLVRRDDKSFMLRNVDNCIHCGQRFIYTDKYIAGEVVVDVIRPPS